MKISVFESYNCFYLGILSIFIYKIKIIPLTPCSTLTLEKLGHPFSSFRTPQFIPLLVEEAGSSGCPLLS